jgi:hypothetical protein
MHQTWQRFGGSRAICKTFFVSLLLTVTCTLHAQVAGTGTIQGTISDPTGAVIPNATVTLTDVANQVKRVAQSDSGGTYIFPNIPLQARQHDAVDAESSAEAWPWMATSTRLHRKQDQPHCARSGAQPQ